MTLAHELGRQLHEVMGWPGPLTWRQWLAWEAWLRGRWNAPNRTDHYLMSVACEVRRVLAKEPGRIKQTDFLLEFRSPDEATQVDQAATAQRAKQQWLERVGGTVEGGG